MQSHRLRSTVLLALTAACSAALAQNVKITPLGSHADELCARDRTTIFEDPKPGCASSTTPASRCSAAMIHAWAGSMWSS